MAKEKETKKIIFEFVADVTRTVEERVEMVIEAEDKEEAYDIADEVILTYPQVQPNIKRFLIRSRFYNEPDTVYLKHPNEDDDEDDEVA